MRALTLFVLLAVSLPTAACAGVRGSGIIKSETRQITAFTQLQLSGGLEVVFKKAPEASLKLEGDDNLLPLIESRNEGERLVVGTKSGTSVSPTRPIHVVVTAPVLRQVDAHGGVNLTLESGTDRDFSIEASGGVDVSAPTLDADSLKVHASGGVELALAGKAKSVVWDLSGGASVKAKGLAASKVTLDASGGCQVDVAAAESVTGDVSGGVNVTVHGDPPKSRVHASGGADVQYVK